LHEIKPDEVYNLAQSHVLVSFDIPESTGDITGDGRGAAAGRHQAGRIGADVPFLPGLVEARCLAPLSRRSTKERYSIRAGLTPAPSYTRTG
jgi:hypothetical protein